MPSLTFLFCGRAMSFPYQGKWHEVPKGLLTLLKGRPYVLVLYTRQEQAPALQIKYQRSYKINKDRPGGRSLRFKF